MYGGSVNNWKKAVKSVVEIPQWLTDFQKCVQGVFTELISHYPDELAKLKEYSRFKDYNQLGTAASWILQHEECRILSCMLEYLRVYKKSVGNCVLCYDGFMMLKEKYTRDLLNKLEEFVYKQLGIEITLSVKEFTTIDLSDISVEEDNDDLAYAPDTPYYDHDIMIDCANRTRFAYETCKEYFERFHAYDLSTDSLVFADIEQNRVLFRSVDKSKTTYGNIFYNGIKREKFFHKWLEDSQRRFIISVDELPYNKPFTVKNVFVGNKMNSFTGFDKRITANITDQQIVEGDKWFNELFYPTLVRLAEGNDEYAKWLLCFFAQIIQHPDDRKERAVIIVGEQGNGKNSVLEAVSRVIGQDHYNTASDPDVFFGQHAIGHAHKLLINCDESSAKNAEKFAAQLKTFVTTGTIEINEKFVKQYIIKNYARLVATSNTVSALPVDFRSGDRRFVMFAAQRFSINGVVYHANSREHGEYFKRYYKVINSEWFPRYFFDKLMSVDISEWDYNACMNTKLKDEMTYISQNSVEVFLDEQAYEVSDWMSKLEPIEHSMLPDNLKVAESDEVIRMEGQELFDMYIDFCTKSNTKAVGKKQFNRFLIEYQHNEVFVDKRHGKKGLYFLVVRNMFKPFECEF